MPKPKRELPPPIIPFRPYRRGTEWTIECPGGQLKVTCDETGTLVSVQVLTDEDRFADQPLMLARVEVTGRSGKVRRFKRQRSVIVDIRPVTDEEV